MTETAFTQEARLPLLVVVLLDIVLVLVVKIIQYQGQKVDMERLIQQRYATCSNHVEYDEETTDVEQQALLPFVKDPKLWMVKCAIGHERKAVVCLM